MAVEVLLENRPEIDDMSPREMVEEILYILRKLEPLAALSEMVVGMKENPMLAAYLGE